MITDNPKGGQRNSYKYDPTVLGMRRKRKPILKRKIRTEKV
jgi:hypothetical protein